MEIATFAGGCFWCTEAVFQMLRGVNKVTPGYAGGRIDDPTYEQVSSGITNHAESVQIIFDPKIISYKDLLYVFIKTHDPTTPNRQGYDAGTQYRSVIFYHDEEQKKAALTALADAQKDYSKPLVTEVSKFQKFFPAEDYHKNYFRLNPEKPYCQLVIDPKIQKLKKDFNKLLKG